MAGNAFWAIPDALRVMMTDLEDYFGINCSINCGKTGHFAEKL